MDREALLAFPGILTQKNKAKERVILSVAKNLSEQKP